MSGWHNESARHSLASKGIKTGSRHAKVYKSSSPKTKTPEEKKIYTELEKQDTATLLGYTNGTWMTSNKNEKVKIALKILDKRIKAEDKLYAGLSPRMESIHINVRHDLTQDEKHFEEMTHSNIRGDKQFAVGIVKECKKIKKDLLHLKTEEQLKDYTEKERTRIINEHSPYSNKDMSNYRLNGESYVLMNLEKYTTKK